MLSPPGTHFTAESTEAMRIKSLAQGENILMLGFEPSTFCIQNRHSNHYNQLFTISHVSVCQHLITVRLQNVEGVPPENSQMHSLEQKITLTLILKLHGKSATKNWIVDFPMAPESRQQLAGR